MANKWDESFGERDDSSSDPENDFESFLRQKVEKCIQDKPASQLTQIPVHLDRADVKIPDPSSPSSVNGAGGDSRPDTPQPIVEESQQNETPLVPVVDVRVTELSTKTATKGARTEEVLVEEAKVLRVDEEWIRISNESFTTAVVNLSCEQIIVRFHDLNKLRFLIPAQQYGLQKALEELLKSRNSEDRAKLLELDKAYRSKQKARSSTDGKAKAPKVAKEKKAVASPSFKATPGTKSADSLKALGFNKQYIIENLMERGLLDKIAGAYVAHLFESKENNEEKKEE